MKIFKVAPNTSPMLTKYKHTERKKEHSIEDLKSFKTLDFVSSIAFKNQILHPVSPSFKGRTEKVVLNESGTFEFDLLPLDFKSMNQENALSDIAFKDKKISEYYEKSVVGLIKQHPFFYLNSAIEKTDNEYKTMRVFFADNNEPINDQIKAEHDFIVYDNRPQFPSYKALCENYFNMNSDFVDYNDRFKEIIDFYTAQQSADKERRVNHQKLVVNYIEKHGVDWLLMRDASVSKSMYYQILKHSRESRTAYALLKLYYHLNVSYMYDKKQKEIAEKMLEFSHRIEPLTKERFSLIKPIENQKIKVDKLRKQKWANYIKTEDLNETYYTSAKTALREMGIKKFENMSPEYVEAQLSKKQGALTDEQKNVYSILREIERIEFEQSQIDKKLKPEEKILDSLVEESDKADTKLREIHKEFHDYCKKNVKDIETFNKEWCKEAKWEIVRETPVWFPDKFA